jgi:1-deoxyxylulose-5-phosphate synthase
MGIFMQFTKFQSNWSNGPRLCLGTGTFGKQTDEAESFRVFDKATDAGVNFIDTDRLRWSGST